VYNASKSWTDRNSNVDRIGAFKKYVIEESAKGKERKTNKKDSRIYRINKRLQHRMYNQQSKQATDRGGLLPSVQACPSSMFADRVEHRALGIGKNLPKQPLQYVPQKKIVGCIPCLLSSCFENETQKGKEKSESG